MEIFRSAKCKLNNDGKQNNEMEFVRVSSDAFDMDGIWNYVGKSSRM